MAKLGLKNRSGTPVSDEVIDAFSGAVAGKVIGPADPEYDSARRIWNASIDKHPGLIVRCAGAADVVQTVKFGRANDLLVSIRGGGHNVAGRALSDDGLVIDLSSMRAVFVDPAKGTARVQGGATLGDLDRETHAFGLAVPAGVVSRTGRGPAHAFPRDAKTSRRRLPRGNLQLLEVRLRKGNERRSDRPYRHASEQDEVSTFGGGH